MAFSRAPSMNATREVELPALMLLSSYDGNWGRYINAVFAEFHHDFIQRIPKLDGLPVYHRRDPIYDGKEAGFWHCTSEGENERDRRPDLRRCERIRWVLATIELAGESCVDRWPTVRGSDRRQLLWLKEQYLVVLAERTRCRDGRKSFQLITAHCTDRDHKIASLRAERDAFHRSRNA